MQEIKNWKDIKASEDFERLTAGGYVCTIIHVEDEPNKQYLKIQYDIAEGDHKDHWASTNERFGWWGGDFYRSYKDSAAGMFKGFINAVEGSNPGYTWSWNEKSLEGKMIGIVLGEEEYTGNDGSVKTRLKVKTVKTVKDIRDGKFRIPPLKRLEPSAEDKTVAETFEAIDTDVPF